MAVSVTEPAQPHQANRPIALLALAIAAFGIGTSEFIIMGLLPSLAKNFSISIPRAGMLVSGYALSVTLGAPAVALATAKIERKSALLLFMSIFVLGNFFCAIAPTYGLLMAARITTALCHGAFFGTGSIVAANMVPRHRRSQAISIMFAGLTLANVMGVPAGTALGQAYGWRASFWAIVPIGILAGTAILWLVPRQEATPGGILQEFAILKRPQVLLVLGMSVMSSASLFCVFTYIAPTLQTITGVSPQATTIVLFIFGIGITIGNLLGGWLSDRSQMGTIIGGMMVLLATLAVLFFSEQYLLPAIGVILLWGLVQFVAGSPLQSRIVDQASGAPNLASTLNQGAFNLGNAAGASLGGLMISAGWGYRSLPWGSFSVVLIALSLALTARSLDKKMAV